MKYLRAVVLVLVLLTACGEVADVAPAAVTPDTGVTTEVPDPTAITEVATTEPVAATRVLGEIPTATATPLPSATATATALPPLPDGEARCGLLLPVIAPDPDVAVNELAGASAAELEAVPEAARAAVRQMLSEPGSVGLATYELGKEGEGVYLNADTPLPLASVVKLVHLITYAEAVQNGELDPEQPVLLAELERYYLANSDLSAHLDAVAELRAEGRVFGDPPAVRLGDVPRMMMEYSSNAATDYLHMHLGQQRLEATIVALGMTSHTAPCPFVGQFLLMSEGAEAAEAYYENPHLYAADVMAATLAYSSEAESGIARVWRGRSQRPEIATQAIYSELFNAHASARDYAALMARIADNQFGPWEQNVRIRSYLEWPTAFPANQPTLAWLGYKGGSLPGVLTSAYYAQPWDRARPVVVVLFFHDLPITTYRQWRRNLPSDELARWLLYDPAAIGTLRDILAP